MAVYCLQAQELLDRPIPEEEIELKQGLSYVRGGWVTQQLNDIFGFHNWDMKVTRIERFTQSITRKGKEEQQPCVLATVELTVSVADSETEVRSVRREDVGCGTGFGPDGWHQAAGEAVTDAMKRAASRLGINTGGMLYLRENDYRRFGSVEPILTAIDCCDSLEQLKALMPEITKLKHHPSFPVVVEAKDRKKKELS